MKKILLSFSLLVITCITFSQTPFTGKVTHKFTTEKEMENGTVEVFYGDQKIRGVKRVVRMDNDYDNDDLLIDFSKGIIYHLNIAQKTYTADTLKIKSAGSFPELVAEPVKNRTILNHHCHAFTINDTAKTGFMDNMDFLFWYADSLYFPVNDKHLLSDEIALFTNGKTIGMGIAISMQEEGKKKLFGLTAIAIEPMLVPDSLFEVPKDYALEITDQGYPQPDSVMMMIDSAAKVTVPPKQPVKKAAPKSTKKKVPVKAAALRRKE